jgi:hypothetical protein
MRWFFLLLISASAVEAQFPLSVPTRPTTFPLNRPTNEGTVSAWGYSGDGQTNVPSGLTGVVQVAGGGAHSLALRYDGTVIAWGGNSRGESSVPSNLSNVVQISAGGYCSLALLSNGTLVGWGDNQFGALSIPQGLTNVVQVRTTGVASYALLADGSVVGWGVFSEVPQFTSPIVQLALTAPANHRAAIYETGNVVQWGSLNFGLTDVPVNLSPVVQVAVGGSFTVALRANGAVVAWGGQGQGPGLTNVPAIATNVVQIAAGMSHSLALASDGCVLAWGSNSDGQTSIPATLSNVVQVAAGSAHSLALVGQPWPALLVERPLGIFVANESSFELSPGLVGSTSNAVSTYFLRNSGRAPLTLSSVAFQGADASHFSVGGLSVSEVQPGQTISFEIAFTPLSGGHKQAALSIESNDPSNNPFTISFGAYGLAQDIDFDGDTLNDAAEYLLRDLGFDWEVAQPTLVSALFDNAATAGLFSSNNVVTNASAFGLYTPTEYAAHFESGRAAGRADVTAAPASFSLFTQAQYDGNRSAGRLDVISDPAGYNLYDDQSIMDLRMGGLMVSKEGSVATVVFQPQTTTDLATQPFTNNGAAITNHFIMPERRAFMRIQAQPTLIPPAP